MRWVSACETGACVEAAYDDGNVFVRSSEEPGTEVMFTVEEWRAFLAGVRSGGFDFGASDA